MTFKLRFDQSIIGDFANRYAADDPLEVEVEKVFAPVVLARGYYTREELIIVCHWKAPRSKPRVAENTEDFVRDVTRTALSTPSEQLRIGSLTLLSGVS